MMTKGLIHLKRVQLSASRSGKATSIPGAPNSLRQVLFMNLPVLELQGMKSRADPPSPGTKQRPDLNLTGAFTTSFYKSQDVKRFQQACHVLPNNRERESTRHLELPNTSGFQSSGIKHVHMPYIGVCIYVYMYICCCFDMYELRSTFLASPKDIDIDPM